ncbi:MULTISPECIES: hypothetical protein [Microvirga]|uniref:DUF2793 domain-containing protein n=2 Tax=Microvirga TaxID=186650 RepID=A0ABW9Z1X9_9HYPH|nr:hypothetical protein [Microvirga arsenatis]NBJ12804.1 hypothetical protein [Microvirga arsenatis]NBJ26663.1 hypothetical protein [Microvirga arsenatis]
MPNRPRRPTAAQAYIYFECRFARGLFCAIPKSGAIPDFLIGAGWKFRGTLGKHGDSPGGFNVPAARAAVRREGCYFFVAAVDEA